MRYIEPKLTKTQKPDALGTPDILLLLSEEIAVVDNLSGKLTLVVYAEPGVPGAWKRAQARLKELLARLREPVAIPAEKPATPQAAASAFGEEAFKQAVARAKQYIVDGDIMQVVLSQRMSKPYAATPLALYRALRTLKGQITDASKREDNLLLINQMQVACVSAKGGKLDEVLKDLKPEEAAAKAKEFRACLLYTSPSPRD